MTGIVLSLAPVFLLIITGFVLRRFHLTPDAFWPTAERLTYYVFFPSLLINNTAVTDLADLDVGRVAASLVLPILLLAVVAVAVRRLLDTDGPTFTSLFQGTIRPNTYVAIAGAFALYGDPGLALTALALVCCVPTVNVLSVGALVRFAAPPGQGGGWRSLVRSVLSNPLVLSPVIGVALNASGIGSPPVIGPFLEVLGRAALPVGLLAVGAGLDLAAVRPAGLVVGLSAVAKLVVLPTLTFAATRLFGLDSLASAVCVLYASIPVSASSYVLARQMGGNAQVMAGIITATTVISALTIPLAISLVI